MENLHDIFSEFQIVSLDELDKAKLMNRMDSKYWFNLERLGSILKAVSKHYYLLNIDGNNLANYSTSYYDTGTNEMYACHHNGKLNRFKIRRRTYVDSGISFLEVKFKSNKKRTIKTRIPTDFEHNNFSQGENDFIEGLVPYAVDDLFPTLSNKFRRFTLVNKNFQERCTIDLNLQFKNGRKTIVLNDLVIVEIKSDGKPRNSPLALVLKEHRIKASGFSKYCMGCTLTDASLKRNRFKRKIRRLEKVIQTRTNLYNIN